ncbi:hypothetical protein [Methylocystis sp. S23]|jgi:hypothetical protein
MKYWILPVLISVGVAQAHAQAPGIAYIYHYQSPVIDVIAGVQLGANNNLTAIQRSPIAVFNVTQIGGINNAGLSQTGYSLRANLVQISSPLPPFFSGQ